VALQGTLDTFALPDVLRLLAATKKTGRLRITGDRGAGSAWIDGGEVVTLEVTHAPHAVEPGDALFELLRFTEGSFTFDPDLTHDSATGSHDVESLIDAAEGLLAEWRQIESVVPSMDAWVTLRRTLDGPVTVDPQHWTTVVAVGSGATVARIADHLGLAELPVSRAVRDLIELGVADLDAQAPAVPEVALVPDPPATVVVGPVTEPTAPSWSALDQGTADTLAEDAVSSMGEPGDDVAAPAPTDLVDVDQPTTEVVDAWTSHDDEPLPVARPIRARRPRGSYRPHEESSTGPQEFVPLELPGSLGGSYDEPVAGGSIEPELAPGVDDLAAAFPGLANRAGSATMTDADEDADELARQLATLSPRAADAVRAAAAAATDEERESVLAEAAAGEDEPVNRGLLLKFLSSVKS
jgi:hypothetical protein